MSTNLFSYHKPEIIRNGDEALIPFSNIGYPYGSIPSDRRFEELVYTIYRQRINHDQEWKRTYDDAQLMQGVGDLGRDCVLYKNKVINAVVQCKKFKKPVNKSEALNEILKFLFYSCVDNYLIPDINNFTYYFVAASGFSKGAISVLDEFSSSLTDETIIQDYFSTLKKKYPSILGSTEFQTIKEELMLKVKLLHIQKVSHLDLDIELAKGFNREIISLFFNVPTNEHENRLIEKINALNSASELQEGIPLTDGEILNKFSIASIQLANYRDYLANMPDTYIPRNEANAILKLIEKKDESDENKLILLTGDPGYGKTAILKQVYNRLIKNGTPVLGIKADRHFAKSITELENQMNLDFPIVDHIRKLQSSYENIVVIFDQIDSLSQSSTTDRSYIDTYNRLLHELMVMDKVKIVISIRTFDLEFDYEFAKLKKAQRIETKPFDANQVEGVLSKIGVRWADLADTLKDLLKIPNHLDTFFKIYNTSIQVNTISTLHDLYSELWKQCVNGGIELGPEIIESTLIMLSGRLYEHQALSLSTSVIESTNQTCLAYLLSMGILLELDREVMFFHQSFHDYVFARAFVDRGESIIRYIRKYEQSIFIRPAIKMILTFLRQQLPLEYERCIIKILFSKGFQYHIQLLIVQRLGYEKKPTSFEKKLVQDRILRSNKYRGLFLEAQRGGTWLSLIVSEGILDQLLFPKVTIRNVITQCSDLVKQLWNRFRGVNGHLSIIGKRNEHNQNIWYSILKRELPNERSIVLNYLSQIKEFQDKDDVVMRLLMGLKIWDDKLAFNLFEKYAYPLTRHEFSFSHLLVDAMNYDTEWCVQQMSKFYRLPSGERGNNTINAHGRIELLERLFETDHQKYFVFSLEFIKKIIEEESFWIGQTQDKIIADGLFDRFDEEEEHISDDRLMMYKLTVSAAEKLASERSSEFTVFLESLVAEKYCSMHRIGLLGILKASEHYSEHAFNILKYLYNMGAFLGSLEFYIREVISKSYSAFSDNQRDALNELILELKAPNELGTYFKNDKKMIYNHIGRLKYSYMSAIPADDLARSPKMKREYVDLYRKFGLITNEKRKTFVLRGAGPPLPETAYKNMSPEQWEDSFLKFDELYRDQSSEFTTGLHGNGQMFEKEVAERPDYFISLIRKIIFEGKVAYNYYVRALCGLSKGNCEIDLYIELFKRVMQYPLANYDMLEFIRSVNYIIDNKAVDKEIVDFICNVAVYNTDPVKARDDEHPEHEMLNTNRGAAVHALVRCFYDDKLSNEIFETFEKVANDPILSVRLCAMHRLAVLMNLDKKRTMQIFLTIVNNTDNEDLLKSALWTAQYLAKYDFKALIPYFEKMIVQQKGLGGTATVLALSWFNNSHGSKELLEKLLKVSDKAKAKVIEVACLNYAAGEENIRNKCLSLYSKYLSSENKDIIHRYNTSFLHIDEGDFKELLPLLKAYSRSKVIRKEPQYFCEYLIKSAKLFPEECLELIAGFNKFQKPNPFEGPYYDGSDPLKVVLGAYNGLCESGTGNKKYLKKAMRQFDRLLKDDFYRTSAYKVLDVV